MVFQHLNALFSGLETSIYNFHQAIPNDIRYMEGRRLAMHYLIRGESNSRKPIGVIPPFSQREP